MMKLVPPLVLLAAAAFSIAAAPAATQKPAATAKPATKPAVKATPKATAKPAKTAVAAPSPTATDPGPAVMDGEWKIAEGEASWKLGKSEVSGKADGRIQATSGMKIAILEFPAGKKEKLHLEFMYDGPGPVDQGYLTRVFAIDDDGRYHAWKKGIGDCTVTLAKGSVQEIEGTASCPNGLLDLEDKPAKPIVDVKFRAKADAVNSAKPVTTPAITP